MIRVDKLIELKKVYFSNIRILSIALFYGLILVFLILKIRTIVKNFRLTQRMANSRQSWTRLTNSSKMKSKRLKISCSETKRKTLIEKIIM